MKFKNVVIFILSLITVWIVVVFFCYKGYFINIEVGQIQLGDCRDFTTQDSVVFDTGADFSYISSNKIGFPFLSPVLVNDGEGNNKILPAQVRKSVDSPPGMLTEDHHHTVHEERHEDSLRTG